MRRRVQGTTNWLYVYNIVATNRTINNLSLGTTYEWEVRTQCPSNSTSSWSQTETFSVSAACTTPQNPDESNVNSSSANLIWDVVSGAVTYKIKWRKIGSPVNVDFTPTNLLSISNLTPSSNYKWRVRSECDNISSNVSAFT